MSNSAQFKSPQKSFAPLFLTQFPTLFFIFCFCFPMMGQEEPFFKCPGYVFPIPLEIPEEAPCDINPNYPNFECLSTIAIGQGTPFHKASDIGPSITGNVCITGNFIVDEPFTFQDAVVRIWPGVEILVNGNAGPFNPENGLVIDNSQLFSCKGLWKGIRMNYQAYVNTRNNSKIEDAEKGIYSYLPGNHLFIQNTTFNRNRIGIELVGDGFLINPKVWTFSGNQFNCTAPLKGTINEFTFAGVKLTNASLLAFPALSFGWFRDLQYGIYAVGTCSIGTNKVVFQRIKKDGIYLESGFLTLMDSGFFFCGEKGINISMARLVNLKNVNYFINNSIPQINPMNKIGVNIAKTSLNASVTVNHFVLNADMSDLGTTITGIGISGIGAGTKIRVDGGSVFSIKANSSVGIRLGGVYPESSLTEVWGNRFRISNFVPVLNYGTPIGILVENGDKNNLSIIGNTFTAYSPVIMPNSIAELQFGQGIVLGTNITGKNNEVSTNAFNDEVQTLHDAIYVNGFQNMKYCSKTLSGSGHKTYGFNFKGTCTGTDLVGNILNFGGGEFPAFSSEALLIQSGTMIGTQSNRGNEWHNFLGSEPLRHARCNALPADNKIIVHTQQSTCADEIAPCFFKYHPKKIVPDDNNEFFDIDPTGSPVEGCVGGSGTDGLDRKIAQGSFVPSNDDPAQAWVLERYLYQKFKDNPTFVSEHFSFPSFMSSKANSSVGRFYEIYKSIQNALRPDESLSAQSLQALADNRILIESLALLDEQIETIGNGSQMQTLYQTKQGLLDQIGTRQSTYNALNTTYQIQTVANLQTAYALNAGTTTAHPYEVNEKTVNQIYLLSLMQQGGELTESQVLTLQAIALQDPKQGGPAVYAALGLLPECAKFEIPQAYSTSDEELLLEWPELTQRNKQIFTHLVDSKVIVAPNPAHSSFTVRGPWETSGRLSLINLQGRLVLSQDFSGKEVTVALDPSILSGIYVLKIFMDDGYSHIERLAIQPN